jgi:hypothetical protein
MFHHVELWGYPKKMWQAGSNHLCAHRSIGFQHHLAAQCHLFDLFVAQKINVLGGARDRIEHVHAPTQRGSELACRRSCAEQTRAVCQPMEDAQVVVSRPSDERRCSQSLEPQIVGCEAGDTVPYTILSAELLELIVGKRKPQIHLVLPHGHVGDVNNVEEALVCHCHQSARNCMLHCA